MGTLFPEGVRRSDSREPEDVEKMRDVVVVSVGNEDAPEVGARYSGQAQLSARPRAGIHDIGPIADHHDARHTAASWNNEWPSGRAQQNQLRSVVPSVARELDRVGGDAASFGTVNAHRMRSSACGRGDRHRAGSKDDSTHQRSRVGLMALGVRFIFVCVPCVGWSDTRITNLAPSTPRTRSPTSRQPAAAAFCGGRPVGRRTGLRSPKG